MNIKMRAVSKCNRPDMIFIYSLYVVMFSPHAAIPVHDSNVIHIWFRRSFDFFFVKLHAII